MLNQYSIINKNKNTNSKQHFIAPINLIQMHSIRKNQTCVQYGIYLENGDWFPREEGNRKQEAWDHTSNRGKNCKISGLYDGLRAKSLAYTNLYSDLLQRGERSKVGLSQYNNIL